MRIPERNRKRKKGLSRTASFSGRPRRLPVARKEKREDGKLCVTVSLERPRWQRRLGGDERVLRTFTLDTFGQEVYAACSGDADVMKIVRGFAKANAIGLAEAEMSVTAFLKTLMAKGLVAMEVDKKGR